MKTPFLPSFSDRHIRWILFFCGIGVSFWVYCLSLLASTWYGKDFLDSVLVFQRDAVDYLALAKQLATTGVFGIVRTGTSITPELFRTPGFPAFLSLFTVTSWGLFLLPIVQGLFHALTVTLIFELGRIVTTRRIGFLAAALYLFEPSALRGTVFVMSETLFTLCFLTVILFLFTCLEKRLYNWRHAILLGAAFGGLAYIRGIMLFFPFAIAALLLAHALLIQRITSWKRLQKPVTLVALTLLVTCGAIAPWIIRNQRTAHFGGFSTLGTFNLFFYNLSDYLAHRDGLSFSEGTQRNLQAIGLSPTTYLKNSPEQIARMGAYTKTVLRTEWPSYALFHLVKGSIFITQSSAKTEFLYTASELIGTKISTPSYSKLLLEGQFGKALSFFREYPFEWLFLLERLCWILLTLLAIGGMLMKRIRSSLPAVLSLGMIFYFWMLTGPVALSRYRLPVAPFLLLLGLSVAGQLVMRLRRTTPILQQP